MKSFECLLKELTEPAINPERWIRKELERTGKEAVGVFLGFCPEELIYAAGMLPVGFWGEETPIQSAFKYFPAFFCRPILSMFEKAVQGAYSGLIKAMVMPVYCDALRSAGQNFKIAVPDIPMIPIVYPVNRKNSSGIRFLADEYREVKQKLQEVSGAAITDQAMEDAVAVYNRYRKAMREFTKAVSEHPAALSPLERHQIITSAYYTDKATFADRILLLTEEIKKLYKENQNTKPVILTGVMLDQKDILEEMNKRSISVISDYLIQESLQFQADVPFAYDGERDICIRLAYRFAEVEYCSTAMDSDKKRIQRLLEEAGERGAGVFVCMPSFCSPEEYDYPLLKEAFDKNEIPHLCLELHTDTSVERIKTVLQTYSEM